MDTSAPERRPDVSVVLPVFNEEGCLAEELDRIKAGLDASQYSYEVIVIDDKSTDSSPQILDRYPWIRRINFSSNRGSGTARRIGTAASRGEVCVWTDADMTYPNDQIPGLVAALGDADQVIGARTTEEGTMRLLRSPVKWLIKSLAQRLARKAIPDLNSGFRAFRTDASRPYLDLLPPGFSCATTMTLTMMMDDCEVTFAPIEYATRVGESKFHPLRDTYRYIVQLLRIITFFAPSRVFFPIAFALMALGGGKMIYDLIAHPFRLATNSLLLLISGVQVLVLGLLADVIVARRR